MEIEDNPNDHVPASVGGISGHLFRRIVHVGMVIFPLLYYFWDGLDYWTDLLLSFNPKQFVSFVAFLLVIIEVIRLKMGLVVFGQRDYESGQLSAFFWGGFSICLVLLLAPEEGVKNSAYGLPLILSLSLVDPIMGELRRAKFSSKTVIKIGYVASFFIWILCSFFVETPMVIAPFISAILVASEWPRLTWIDDNATMLLIPLTFILLLTPFL
tara:strand:+ start:2026 stop:2664 length:639 start_codon:yes stop_codon:yes gene_type:complete